MDLTAKQTLNTTIYVESLDEENILFRDKDLVRSIPWVSWFETWLESLRDNLPVADGYEISLRLTSDREIQILNNQYRHKNQPTDVLAFAITEADIPLPIDINEPLYLGDIVISLDTAARQAQNQNHSVVVELAWLSSHGLLHLLGWEHPNDESLTKMLKKQENLLQIVNTVGDFN